MIFVNIITLYYSTDKLRKNIDYHNKKFQKEFIQNKNTIFTLF